MLPDTYCSDLGPQYGYQCPEGMKCAKIQIERQDRGFNGFDEIGFFISTLFLHFCVILKLEIYHVHI